MSDAGELREILTQLRGRFFGKYRGTVKDVDPTTMSLTAYVPAVLGTQPTGWCQPCVPYAGAAVGLLMLPPVGAGVWVEFEGGDVSMPIWVGCFWRQGEVPGTSQANVYSLITQAGSITLDEGAGSITISGTQGQTVVVDSNGVTLTVESSSVADSSSSVALNGSALTVSS